ncbi:MAG: phosphatidate cytidylyltransferase [Cyanobacteria bacterium]|nr:phosphatidate cytidylyltransferase [Cyanobacteriota bacterium]
MPAGKVGADAGQQQQVADDDEAIKSGERGHPAAEKRSRPRAYPHSARKALTGSSRTARYAGDRGVKDYGAFIDGHGGTFDRIDPLWFAATAFFHPTRYFYSV